jgi:hypothetical protein
MTVAGNELTDMSAIVVRRQALQQRVNGDGPKEQGAGMLSSMTGLSCSYHRRLCHSSCGKPLKVDKHQSYMLLFKMATVLSGPPEQHCS